jgi:hypothetical protein
MRLTMSERRAVTKEYAARYRKARKKEKGRILTEFVGSTEFNRVYAARLLRRHGARVQVKPGVVLEGDAGARGKRGRPCEYGPDVAKALKPVWETLDFICDKRLVVALREVVPQLVCATGHMDDRLDRAHALHLSKVPRGQAADAGGSRTMMRLQG